VPGLHPGRMQGIQGTVGRRGAGWAGARLGGLGCVPQTWRYRQQGANSPLTPVSLFLAGGGSWAAFSLPCGIVNDAGLAAVTAPQARVRAQGSGSLCPISYLPRWEQPGQVGTRLLLVQAWPLSPPLGTQGRWGMRSAVLPSRSVQYLLFQLPPSPLLLLGYKATQTAKEKPKDRTCSFMERRCLAWVWRGGCESPDVVFPSLCPGCLGGSPQSQTACGKAGVSPGALRL